MFKYIRVCIKTIKKNKMFFAHFLKLYKNFGMTVCKKKQTLKRCTKYEHQKLSRNIHETGNGFTQEIHNFWMRRGLPVVEYQYCRTPGSLKTVQK